MLKNQKLDNLMRFFDKLSRDNLFLLSSSISYYSTLALAPFILILLTGASLINQDIQAKIIQHANENFSSKMADMFEIIFGSVNSNISMSTFSGILGLVFLLWTCSLVFLQFRYSFDLIYGFHDPEKPFSFKEFASERLFSMLMVVLGAAILIADLAVIAVIEYIFDGVEQKLVTYRGFAFLFNLATYILIFTGLHILTPSHRQKVRDAFRIALINSFFFILGNVLLASYLLEVSGRSIFGVAGTLLVFLVWSYYSSFTVFLSVELYVFLKKHGKIR